MSEMRSDGGGAIHVAVWVPVEEAEARVSAALAAGGHMVRDQYRQPGGRWPTPRGNEADIATTVGRD